MLHKPRDGGRVGLCWPGSENAVHAYDVPVLKA